MGYQTLAEPGVVPVFDEIMEQKLLKHNLFAFYMTSKKHEEKGLKPDLTFGYYDRAKFKGHIHWMPVLYKYMYGIRLDDVLVDGKSTGVCAKQKCLITMDSGTTYMSVPTYAANILVKKGIPTSKRHIECENP